MGQGGVSQQTGTVGHHGTEWRGEGSAEGTCGPMGILN